MLPVAARPRSAKSRRISSHIELARTAVGLREIAKKIGRAQMVWVSPPRTVLIVTKVHDSSLVRMTKDVSAWLINRGMNSDAPGTPTEPASPTSTKSSTSILVSAKRVDRLLLWDDEYCATRGAQEVDFVITLGGDGTVLYAAWLFQDKCPPMIPFHLGSLGFLTVFDFANFRKSITDIVENEAGVRMNFRMRFSCTVHRRRTAEGEDDSAGARDGETFQILNDLVVDRGPSPYMSQLELYGNDRHLTTVQADGLAVATPTGSTAYSLSAGGSLVHPDVSAILVSPICPHTLSFRPMIFPDTFELRICVPEDSRATAWASFDGRRRVQLRQGDSVTVVASPSPVPTVCEVDQSADWFNGLERCLGWNKRERQKAFKTSEW
ncbi:ATP-NAD kinase-like domain-containing protein [Blyttiomyces helicus]|uniref:ATP-NAD kinase-like domain-containing protein n=1 Tax=Blyttiomyces helicus TaxID=388810 RepID=A0A4P9WPZ3_9FUNG|nr:ATP-NAD kinase-like domain-containing protein [Blyttiomyces helicus]|eukprot:RKO92906.1 ATP-NAD kinase-like domain-containing protein [Blyttiomyces helicus]